MILTGKKIETERKRGNIVISPFLKTQINPNSYNYRIGTKLKVFSQFREGKALFKEIVIPEDGYLLKPKQTYLGHTFEIIGSNKYAISLIGRSSVGRLGLFLQLSANLGHTGMCHNWTLEIVALKPFIIYPKMKIGQVTFWTNYGDISLYKGLYGNTNNPLESYNIVK